MKTANPEVKTQELLPEAAFASRKQVPGLDSAYAYEASSDFSRRYRTDNII